VTHVELFPDIFVVTSGAFPFCNSVVILNDENAIVDPGCSLEHLRALLRTRALDLKDIDVVLLSHIHPDHITHAARIQRFSQCRIAANEITAPLFDDKEKMKQFLGFVLSNPVRSQWEDLVNRWMSGCLDKGRVDEIVKDNEKIGIGELSMRMVYTPGHLPDHMCVELIEPNLLFTADIDCTEFGPYYGHPSSSISEFKKSIEIISQNQYNGIISGHLKQPLIREYSSALAAYSRQIDTREDLVLAAIMDGKTSVEEVARTPIIYPNHPNPVFLQFEIWMVEHHVSSLIQRGLVERKRERLRAI